MNEAIEQMLARYQLVTREDSLNALREILQQIALLGLWRGKFFEHAAFYGGTALRVLYGLDRYSEDLDFSLLESNPAFTLETYQESLCRELLSFGFEVSFQVQRKNNSAIESAFLKANTLQHLILIRATHLTGQLHRDEVLKIKLEVDTDPPAGFATESRAILLPVPFSVRAYSLPDLFAGKMHALLCRKWKPRVKGRDWYDLVWYLARHPRLHLAHLEQRLRASGHWEGSTPFSRVNLLELLDQTIARVDLEQARQEVSRFVRDPSSLQVWSEPFFREIIARMETV
ncbi:MAG: nucleotidyl transferase AbiEii/AbiGii toxin family protein [Candidatus Eremiobacteraeota bacterium]|nr:nucleotidyl transferase AbiEii/AbiGii toxin family protein [Candidatus Eremiobacteraeota bacterium]MCW5867563.1 nucleotidyl transferase AbiEii/AbiGii toxin family protein [Candidatus Eremiobacteraeota bacterium]